MRVVLWAVAAVWLAAGLVLFWVYLGWLCRDLVGGILASVLVALGLMRRPAEGRPAQLRWRRRRIR